MKKTFVGYYTPTEEQFAELWGKCLFTFDANVLLNLYRYTPKTRDSFVQVLKKVSDRIWLSHQAGLEYHRNRLLVIQQQADAYGTLQKALEDYLNKIETTLNTFARHPYIDTTTILESVKKCFQERKDTLKEINEKHPDLTEKDQVMEIISELFDGRVGEPYDATRITHIFSEGKKRYEKKIPPGFMDKKEKENDREYGDLVLWYQVMDKAKEEKRPMILVTDDRKDDWWWKHEGKTMGPHPDLLIEFAGYAGVPFYLYAADPFLRYANKYLSQSVAEDVINEVREVRQQDEKNNRVTAQSLYSVLFKQYLKDLKIPIKDITEEYGTEMERRRSAMEAVRNSLYALWDTQDSQRLYVALDRDARLPSRIDDIAKEAGEDTGSPNKEEQ